MILRLTADDEAMLCSLVQYRVLSANHLAVLLRRNAPALRRRLGRLKDQGLVHVFTRAVGLCRGRPDNLIAVSKDGLEVLKGRGLVGRDLAYETIVPKTHCLEHELLISEFRVQAAQMERLVCSLGVRFFPSEPAHTVGPPRDQRSDRERSGTDAIFGEEAGFIPDGIIAVTHGESAKTVLFFLEADRGTEPTSSARAGRGIQSKIVNYQKYFQSSGYKHYEKVLSCPLRGFRVLFLATNESRLASLCRVVREMHPTGFIWLTERGRMANLGIWAPIWVKGGQTDQALDSILGTQAPVPCPSPA